MSRYRNLWIIGGIGILAAALISGFVLMQPSAQDILASSLESSKSINDGHAVVAIKVATLDKHASGTVEVWASREEDGPGKFRLEVLEASESKYVGAEIVSDGETLWAYSPSENEVFVGTPEEARMMMEESEFLSGKLGSIPQDFDGKSGDGEHEPLDNGEQAVQKLAEYFNIGKSDSETVAGETAEKLKLEPIAEQMPDEYAAIGGFINLWIGQESGTPLAVEFTGSSLGDGSATVLEYDINPGVDQNLFTFEIPVGASVVTFADLEPKTLTLEEAGESTDFEFLTPVNLPTGATLVDILEVGGTLVQRYTLPDGGSFTLAQGVIDQDAARDWQPSSKSQSVEVRGVTGQLFQAEDGSQIMLTWTDGELFYSVAGDLSPEQALTIGESLQ
ncbi:MAG: DUF4367 domain-containing protein [Anaerolineales bacterium]|jgi:outer membrane lipoprotein-sorting protein